MGKQTKSAMDGLLDEDDEVQSQSPKPSSKSLPAEDDVVIEAETPMAQPTSRPSAAVTPQQIRDFRSAKLRGRDKMISNIGISSKFLPPLTRKRSAIYQLIRHKSVKDMRLTGVDQYPDPPPYQLVPNYTFIDTDEIDLSRREKTMTYLEGGTEIVYTTDPITKKSIPQSIPKIGSPEFINGQAVVNIYNQYGRYAWWELHPQNATNKWRPSNVTPIFERVDTKFEGPHVANIKADLKLDAERYVLGLKPDAMINLASSLTNPTVMTNINPQELRLVLRNRARQNPEEILFTAHNELASVKIAIIHALDLGILTFVPENEAYYFSDETEPFFVVPTGNNPFDSVCDFLVTSKGSEVYGHIKTDLDFWF